jgi:glutamate/tyrosine decarboxylase-like PLP-dependent enzyme
MTGTRPGGAIAAAWAVVNHLGEDGYLRIAKRVLDTTKKLQDGVAAIDGLRILGKPAMSVFAFNSDVLDVYALGDAMEAKGWSLDRQQRPPALHLMVTPAHEPIADHFLADLRACVDSLKKGEPAPDGSAALYGMLGAVPETTAREGFLLEMMDGIYD